jgi:Family of unknown function (DUF6152)
MKFKCMLLVACACAMTALPALAHHSFAAEFDAKQPLTLKGTVTKVEWTNPHAWFYIDVKDDSGAVVHWQCETGPPNMLSRNGWRKDSLKPGDQVTVNGFRAKDGTNTATAREVLLPSGKKVFSGNAADVGQR